MPVTSSPNTMASSHSKPAWCLHSGSNASSTDTGQRKSSEKNHFDQISVKDEGKKIENLRENFNLFSCRIGLVPIRY